MDRKKAKDRTRKAKAPGYEEGVLRGEWIVRQSGCDRRESERLHEFYDMEQFRALATGDPEAEYLRGLAMATGFHANTGGFLSSLGRKDTPRR